MDIIKKYCLELKKIKIKDISFDLYHTDNLDNFFNNLNPVDFEKDERFPYFVNIWQSGLYLSKFLIEDFPRNKITDHDFLELGSGTGITGLTLSLLGGIVTFSDYEEDSIQLCKINSSINGIEKIDSMLADWRNFPKTDKKYNYIIGSDLLYEKRFLNPLVHTTEYFLNNNSIFIYSDPGRNYYNEYLDIMQKNNFKTELLKEIKLEKNQNIKIFMIKK